MKTKENQWKTAKKQWKPLVFLCFYWFSMISQFGKTRILNSRMLNRQLTPGRKVSREEFGRSLGQMKGRELSQKVFPETFGAGNFKDPGWECLRKDFLGKFPALHSSQTPPGEFSGRELIGDSASGNKVFSSFQIGEIIKN